MIVRDVYNILNACLAFLVSSLEFLAQLSHFRLKHLALDFAARTLKRVQNGLEIKLVDISEEGLDRIIIPSIMEEEEAGGRASWSYPSTYYQSIEAIHSLQMALLAGPHDIVHCIEGCMEDKVMEVLSWLLSRLQCEQVGLKHWSVIRANDHKDKNR